MERPRFYTGMLLTESELNGVESYVTAKNRLHNRLLHGYGIVCGLEVERSQCEGWLLIHQGYAIDACGNDIIVCKDESIDVLAAIRACRDAADQVKTPCDPYQPYSPQPPCKGTEEWCITIQYKEREARPMVALRNPPSRTCECGVNCGGGCNCKRTSCGCGAKGSCGCGSQAGPTRPVAAGINLMATQKSLSGVTTLAPCEPTRILEGYCIEVSIRQSDTCVSPREQLAGTNYERVRACAKKLEEWLTKHGPRFPDLWTLLYDPTGTVSDSDFAELMKYLGELRKAHTCGTPEQHGRRVGPAYLQQSGPSYVAQLEALAQGEKKDLKQSTVPMSTVADQVACALIDCGCCHCDCPPDPCDDRLVLACVTVDWDDDKVLGIEGCGCRRYVPVACGDPCTSWVSVLHAGPVSSYTPAPEFGALIEKHADELRTMRDHLDALRLEVSSLMGGSARKERGISVRRAVAEEETHG
jgi:hypothetical protein